MELIHIHLILQRNFDSLFDMHFDFFSFPGVHVIEFRKGI